MKHPNAIATLTSTSIVLAGEQLLQDYLNVHLPGFWAKAIMAAVATGVLWVGRDGVKGALIRLDRLGWRIWDPKSARAKA